jgi:hypothetical protein
VITERELNQRINALQISSSDQREWIKILLPIIQGAEEDEGGYATIEDLADALATYVDTGELTSTLADYVTADALTTALADYLPTADHPSIYLSSFADLVVDDDWTAAIQGAYNSVVRTSPVGFAQWGKCTIIIDKGNFTVNGTVTLTSAIGIKFLGQGPYATNIIRTNDEGIMFDASLYIDLAFEGITFIHDTETTKDTWTNKLIRTTGAGGGRNLYLEAVETHKFGTVISQEGTVNEDRTSVRRCYFRDFRIFIDSQNAQGMANTYQDVSWMGDTDSVFYVAGHQQRSRLHGHQYEVRVVQRRRD